jgi:hypothetical protein
MTTVVRRDLTGIAESPLWVPGVSCITCAHPGVSGTHCTACGEHDLIRRSLGGFADRVVPLTYAWWGTQIWNDVYNYKKSDRDLATPGLIRLQKLGWWGSVLHQGCIEGLGPAGSSHALVTVPSSAGRVGVHPLESIAGLLPEGWERLGAHPHLPVGRKYSPTAFAFDQPARVQGKHVIVFDDTWATGARAQSLATAAKYVGASSVTVLVLANHLKPSAWAPLADFRKQNPSLPWGVNICPVSGGACPA